MSLANLVVPEDHHTIGDQEIRLTGLSMEAIVMLLQDNKPVLEAMMDTGLTSQKLIQIAPVFVAKMIAYSANEPDMVEHARKIPFGDQVVMVNKIWNLTHVDMEEVGKVVGLVADTMDGMASARPSGEVLPNTVEAPPISSSRRAK